MVQVLVRVRWLVRRVVVLPPHHVRVFVSFVHVHFAVLSPSPVVDIHQQKSPVQCLFVSAAHTCSVVCSAEARVPASSSTVNFT